MKQRSPFARAVVLAAVMTQTKSFAVEPTSLAIKPAVPYAATPLPLSAVRLTGGPLKVAQDLDREYLLKLEPDRMLAFMRERAGLPRKAEPYGGWDGAGRALTGHIAGHYMSAVSLMYEATGDERFKQRADYMVAEFKDVQNARGDGYVGALLGDAERKGDAASSVDDKKPLLDGDVLFKRLAAGDIRSGGFDLNGMWSPWYVQHKLYAGLRDAYRATGNKAALDVEVKFAEWCDNVVGKLNDAQVQKMLHTEFGGMNEVLVDLYADTGDARWLKLAGQFHHKAILDPLAEGRNVLGGTHGNTQIPKLLGSLAEYVYTGNPAAGNAARTFWDAVVAHHTFATGGHGYDEYFGQPDKLSGQVDGTGQRSRDLRTAESCNVYNMLKMTRRLFALKPDARYADFQERALFNHVLASINSADGRTCYMVPVSPGVAHEYQGMFTDFTCCVGTGMENHALHGDGLYYTEAGSGNDKLLVNVYAPSIATWAEKNVTLTIETDMPVGDRVTIKVGVKTPTDFTLSLRNPTWATPGATVAVNGKPYQYSVADRPAYIDVRRTWLDGDTVTVTLPHTLRTEPLADNPHRVALMWGPLVLAGDFGERAADEAATAKPIEFPVFNNGDKPLAEWIKPVHGKPGQFTGTLVNGRSVSLAPFYTLHDRRYGLYWDVFTPGEWSARKAAYDAEQDRRKKLAEATVAFVQLGEMQPERDYNFQGDGSITLRTDGQPGRSGGKWISFDVPVDPAKPNTLAVTTADARAMDGVTVTVDGANAGPARNAGDGGAFVDTLFAFTPAAGKDRVTVRLSGKDGKPLPAIYGIRVSRTTSGN